MSDNDDNFFDRADEYIDISNKYLSNVTAGKVSASMLYGTARFNAFISACSFDNVAQMKKAKQGIMDYFVGEYKKMLEENLDDYIEHFDEYMQ